jgi:TolB-like protein/cytochrome c-type biogenesis protein CcmH/NrfG
MSTTNAFSPPAAPDESSPSLILFPESPAGRQSPSVPLPASEFEIGHVLFIDIVGYSKLLIDEQRDRLRKLNEIVRGTGQFRRAESDGKLVRLPTGDGMALVFRNSPEAPPQCALEISEALKRYPELRLRMGIHSGPVNEVSDVNERANIAGAGINIAQRVMDCGDAGHILISKHVAEDLEHSARWQPNLHDLGEYEVKHSVVISVVNLYTAEFGNSAVPVRFLQAEKQPSAAVPSIKARSAQSAKPALLLSIAAATSVLALAFWLFTQGNKPKSTSVSIASPVTSSSIPEKSIAVLPFANLSANQETGFFTDGVQDEILTDLAKIGDLKVISRTSVMRYRNLASENLRDVAQQLGVHYVVEGSVQRAANRIRLNAQLIDARSDTHLWAHSYDRDLADVFAIQSEIAKTIADQLQAKLSAKEEAALNQKPTTDLVAYDLYLQAMQIDRNRASSTGSGGAEETRREIKLLSEAIRHDPAFVPAICLLAQTHLYLYWMNADQPAVHLDLAKKALETAARLQPDGSEVHLTRGILFYWGARDYASALAEVDIARRSLPNDTRVLFTLAMIERRQNNWQDSTHHIEQALVLDPCNLTMVSELAGSNYLALRRYADAARTLDNALTWKPLDFNIGFLRAYVDMAWKADLRRWRAVVDGEIAKTADANDLITARLDLALKERNYQWAEQILRGGGGAEVDDNGFFTPREWKEATVARGLGDQSRANSALRAARERAAVTLHERPDDAKALIVLGQIDAALGQKQDALREGQRAAELLPVAKDAINGYQLLVRLATIYAQTGERDRAFDLLSKEIFQPYGPAYGSLKLDEVWDPLRRDPRFDRLVTSLAPAAESPTSQ